MSVPADDRPSPAPAAPDPRALLRRSDLLVDSALSPAVFVGVNLAAGLKAGALAALALAVAIMVFRLVRRQDLTYAVGGVIGTGVAVAIALKTGTTSGFFWPKVLTNAAICAGLVASVVVRRPAIGLGLEHVLQFPGAWCRHPRVRPALAEWTLVWAATAAVKAVVYLVLILNGRDGALLGVSVAFGYPTTAVLGFGGLLYVRARLKRLGAPPTDAFRAAVPA